MPNVRRTVQIHERTVQKAATQKVETPKRKRKSPSKRSTPVVVKHWSDGVDPRIIWYITANNIHHSRIKVIGPGEVLIVNGEN